MSALEGEVIDRFYIVAPPLRILRAEGWRCRSEREADERRRGSGRGGGEAGRATERRLTSDARAATDARVKARTRDARRARREVDTTTPAVATSDSKEP